MGEVFVALQQNATITLLKWRPPPIHTIWTDGNLNQLADMDLLSLLEVDADAQYQQTSIHPQHRTNSVAPPARHNYTRRYCSMLNQFITTNGRIIAAIFCGLRC